MSMPAGTVTPGVRVFGLAALLLGVSGLVWDDFALVWQPVPADLPGRALLAYVVASLFAVSGVALQRQSWLRAGAVTLTILYALDVLVLHVPRCIGHPDIFVEWSGLAEQLALLAAAVLMCLPLFHLHESRRLQQAVIARLTFAACLVCFGLAHFIYLSATADFVPHWIPPGGRFWAITTGFVHILGGVAILTGVLASLAAWLIVLMFVGFGLLVHAPLLFAAPADHMSWAANAVNLSLIGAAWIIAEALDRGRSRRNE
jgi:uncharacterized membrane protein YphA (DoxX/SURF4 family)